MNARKPTKNRSAGLLVYRGTGEALEVLLAHPGGPYFVNKDEGSWTVPKGLIEAGESELEAAVREFEEETSFSVASDEFVDLGEVRQKGGKVVHAWACAGNFDPAEMTSNVFPVEWPPRSGRRELFPEIDRIAWFDPDTARRKINSAQRTFIDRLEEALEA